MEGNSPPGKRVGPAAVGSPTGCKKASWKTSRKPGAEDGGQTHSPPLKLQNRYQALAEESDGEEETRDGESVPPPQLERVQGSGPYQPTSVHTGNGVTTDWGLVSLEPAPRGSKSQSGRTRQKTTGSRKVARDEAQDEPTRDSPERLIRETPPSVSTGQSVPVVSKRPAAGQGRPEPTT